jgi:transposase
MIIEQYHELYKVEQAFRISKNDLQTRPIFHFKEQPIKLHILICFMALVVSKHIELKTGVPIRKFIDESKKVVDGEILLVLVNRNVDIFQMEYFVDVDAGQKVAHNLCFYSSY